MAYDPVRFLVVRDFLRFPRSFHWQDRLPDQLKTVKDRRFYCHLLQGMIRHRRLLQTEVCNRVDKPFHKLQKSLVGILALGIYQLLFMNRIPTRASIYESVALAHPFRIIAQKSLINAVLRNLASDLENNYSYHHHSLAIRTSHQDWMVARWQAFYAPAQVESICTANNIFEGVTIRAMPPWKREGLLECLEKEGLSARLHPIAAQALVVENAADLFHTSAFQQGACYVQDSSSQIFLDCTTPLWKGNVLDVCAAPGGKSIGILQAPYRKNLFLNDCSPKRMRRLRHNMKCLRLPTRGLLVSDGLQLPFKSPFDVILLDVPCSSTGTIRKNPDIKWIASKEILLNKIHLQQHLLNKAAHLLKAEGLLVYVTCSLEMEENELQIEHLLRNHPDYAILPFQQFLTHSTPWLPFLTGEGFFKTLPSSHWMGLFAAVLKRRTGRGPNHYS